MKSKNLIILVAAAIIFGGIAYFTSRTQTTETAASSEIGKYAVPEFQDAEKVNSITKITFTTVDSIISFTKTDAGWGSESKYGYPADFENVLNFVKDIRKIKISDALASDQAMTEQLTLFSPVGIAPEKTPTAGILIQFFNAEGKQVSSLIVGKEHRRAGGKASQGVFGNYPDGRFISVSDKIYLVSETFEGIPSNESEWFNDSLSTVFAGDIMQINVTDDKGKTLSLQRAKAENPLTLAKLSRKKEMQTSEVNSLAGVLNYLSFTDIADPALKTSDTGMDKPTTYQATLNNGQSYTLSIGKTVKESSSRYVKLAVSFTPPTPAEKPDGDDKTAPADDRVASETEALKKRLGSWTYLVDEERLKIVSTDRSRFEKKIEKKKKDAKKDGSKDK